MDGVRAARIWAAALGVALALACCSPTPSPVPATPDVSVVDGVAIGCVSFEQLECEAVAKRLLALVPGGGAAPFSVLLVLFDCPNGGPCAKSLAIREGRATVEFPGGRDQMEFTLGGPPDAPRLQAQDVDPRWSPLRQPTSARVVGVGPFPFDLGHCGLSWQVDFDGSFWVPVGQIDGTASEVVNSGAGTMRLLGPNLAVYTGAEGFTAGLQRFPGPKHVSLCA